MSRRLGAYVVWDQYDFAPHVRALVAEVEDLSPVMRTIGYRAAAEGRRQAVNNPAWPPLSPATLERKRRAGAPLVPGVGVHGGFVSTIVPFFGRRNAGWKTRAPHAHLFELGTSRHFMKDTGEKVNLWSAGKGVVGKGKNKGKVKSKHKAKGISASLAKKVNSLVHQPARPFAYFRDGFHEEANELIVKHLQSVWSRLGGKAA